MSEIQNGWLFRLAEVSDAEAFSKWAAENPNIDQKDLIACLKVNNPTVIFFVAVNPEGKAVAFAPLYLQMTMGYLGFNPESRASEKLRAMQVLIDGTTAFAVQFGIREITTMSREGYGVADWAVNHGFEFEPRQQLKLDINKQLSVAGEEQKCAPAAAK